MFKKILSAAVTMLALSGLMVSPMAMADTVKLGAAVSLSGKYSTAGNHTQKGYDLGVKYVNSLGGVFVDGKSYKAPATKLLVLPPNQVDKIRQAEKNKQEKDLKQAAFLEFNCPRPFLFKGETTEATIDLFLWNKLPVTAIEQAPLNNANEFPVSPLRKTLT